MRNELSAAFNPEPVAGDDASNPHSSVATSDSEGPKLHVGCGKTILPGWINIDIEDLPGVDLVLDVREGFAFDEASFVFAEHFIEHLSFSDGLAFLRDCRRVLSDSGILRLTTPNLDWVWQHQYHPDEWDSAAEAQRDCFWMNRAFHGWGHRFLYNRQTLVEVLREAGFGRTEEMPYGHSRNPVLRDLERHETYPESPDTPHIIVIEATGASRPHRPTIHTARIEYLEATAT